MERRAEAMTYFLIVLSILADDPLTAAFCIGMAATGTYLVAGLWLGS